MDILGYSERGLINSLLYAIRYRENASTLVSRLMRTAHWPARSEMATQQFDHCKLIMIEQSFSDFGDADAVLLFGEERGPSVFLEGKRGSQFRLAEEWKRFSYACTNRCGFGGLTSNVFCQLHFKQRMVEAVASPASGGDIHCGLHFDIPLAHPRRDRKIGRNSVVLEAVRKLAPHANDAFFLMMVPEDAAIIERWWRQTLCAARPAGPCDFSSWGFISIRDIERFCIEFELDETLQVLEFNKGQLF
jgi:hypothetical protein